MKFINVEEDHINELIEESMEASRIELATFGNNNQNIITAMTVTEQDRTINTEEDKTEMILNQGENNEIEIEDQS